MKNRVFSCPRNIHHAPLKIAATTPIVKKLSRKLTIVMPATLFIISEQYIHQFIAFNFESCCYPKIPEYQRLVHIRSFFSPAPPSPSTLPCLRIRLLFSIHAHTTSTYAPALSWIFLPQVFVVPLILLFLILSSLVTPLIHVNILISATSNFFSCAFFMHCPRLGTVHHCWSYNCLLCFPLDSQTYSIGRTESPIHSSSFSFLIVFYVISASKSTFSASVAPRYLNVFTLSKFSPCRLISEFPSKFPSPLNLR